MKKFCSIIISICMTAGILFGGLLPGKQAEAMSTSLNGKDIAVQNSSGDKVYTEKNIELPKIDMAGGESIVGLTCNSKGYCEVYTVKYVYSSKLITGVIRYTQNNKGVWKASNIKWSEAFGTNTTKYPYQFQYSDNGELYCYTYDLVDYSTAQSIVKIAKDGSVKKVNIAALEEKTTYGMYPNINSYAVTSSYFVFSSYSGLFIVDLKTGKTVYHTTNYNAMNMTAGSDTLSFVDMNTDKLLSLKIKTGEKVSSYPLSTYDNIKASNLSEELIGTYLFSQGDKLYSLSRSGIYQYSEDKDLCLVNGYGNQLSRPSRSLHRAAMSRDGQFYTLSQDSNYSYNLYKYSIADASDIKYQSTFTIAMYEKDERIIETVASLAQQHPEIRFDCIYIAKDSDIAVQEKQWDKADIIVCNNSTYKVLMKDNLLKDIGTTAQSLVSSEGLYKNVTDSFTKDGSLYVIPTEFSPYIYAGNKSLLESTESLVSLEEYSKKSGKSVWQGVGYETLGNVLYRVFNSQLTDANGNWNEEGIRQLLNNVKITSTIDKSNMWNTKDNWFDNTCFSQYLQYSDSLLATTIDNANDLSLLLTVLKKTGGSYRCTGAFEADSLVGVNKKANESMTDEFLKVLFGIEAQSTKIGNGIPMRSNIVTEWKDAYISSYYIDPATYEFVMGDALTQNNVTDFQAKLSGVSDFIKYDEKQNTAMMEAMELYLIDRKSLEDTVTKISSNQSYQKVYTSLGLDTSDELKVVFIGNSLTSVGDLPKQFAKMAELSGRKVKVDTILGDGFTLNQHINTISKSSDKAKLLKEADVVILQEHGNYSGTTVLDVLNLMDMASKDAHFLFLQTFFDSNPDSDRERRLGQIDNLTMIPAGSVHDYMIEDNYNYEDLHLTNDYHPNPLNAVVTAETVYVTLFGKDLSHITYNDFSDLISKYVKGTTKKQKEKEFINIQKAVLKFFN